MKSEKEYSKLLSPEVVSKLKTLELKAKYVVEGFMVGHHKSPYHGFSAEFSEHRPYNQGDPIRNIDWKAYAKTERFFIKRFEEETNLISHILLDSSASMNFKREGEITKFEYGRILAASLSYLLINQQDAVGFSLFSNKLQITLPPKANRVYLKEILTNLSNIKPSESTTTEKCLQQVAETIKKKGLIIVISDFFDELDSVVRALKLFRYKQNEVIVFQILDPAEINFSFSKDAVFVDLETREEISTQPYQIQKSYQLAMKEFLRKISEQCLNHGIDYNLVTTDMPFDKALFAYFRKRSRIN